MKLLVAILVIKLLSNHIQCVQKVIGVAPESKWLYTAISKIIEKLISYCLKVTAIYCPLSLHIIEWRALLSFAIISRFPSISHTCDISPLILYVNFKIDVREIFLTYKSADGVDQLNRGKKSGDKYTKL